MIQLRLRSPHWVVLELVLVLCPALKTANPGVHVEGDFENTNTGEQAAPASLACAVPVCFMPEEAWHSLSWCSALAGCLLPTQIWGYGGMGQERGALAGRGF